jgi:hypothetical protein
LILPTQVCTNGFLLLQMMERGEVPTQKSAVHCSQLGVEEAKCTAKAKDQDSEDDIDISVLEELESMCW